MPGIDDTSRVTSTGLVVAGLSGDSGKTLVSLALILALRERGIDVQPFKKGPDYIDAAWLSWAAGADARNLDTWMAGFDRAREAFARHATRHGVNLVEGNRGLFDGVDAEGTHSTAELAKALHAPVVLVVDARKATRTLAACVLGCQAFDPDLRIAGVILNRVGGGRHHAIARAAIESRCGIAVLGSIPRVENDNLPGRHLGLVTPAEHPAIDRVRKHALAVANHIDIDAVVAVASRPAVPPDSGRLRDVVADLARDPGARSQCEGGGGGDQPRLRIGCLHDSAFSFYYPDNLEALVKAGAVLVPLSSLAGGALPPGLDALYIGGGFPETHAQALSANRELLDSIRDGAAAGLPIYAECGGLILLARSITWKGSRHQMSGVLPFDIEMCERPQGHGYSVLAVEKANPFFPVGTLLRGHEFHYSRPADRGESAAAIASLTACAVERGVGCGAGRDAVTVDNVWAAYTHLHALATPEWARGMVNAAESYRKKNNARWPVVGGKRPNR